MSEYKGIRGFKVQTLSTDPAASAVVGGTWASGGNLNTGRADHGGAGGSNSDALAFAGTPSVPRTITESYNGTSWTEVADLNLGRNSGAGIGTSSTAALYVSGYIPPILTPPTATKTETEEWNGTSWTEIADVNIGRWRLRGCGVTTAAIVIGGGNPWPLTPTSAITASTELYNGTSWTEVNDLNQLKRQVFAFGTSTAGLSAGGYTGTAQTSNTELWDGTSWTEVNNLNTARSSGAAAGVQTLGIINAGEPANALTEYWNGTSWTEIADSVVNYGTVASSNLSSTSALKFGGEPGAQQATEEWTAPSVFSKENLGQVYYNSTSNAFKVTKQSVPAGTWASGGNLNTGRGNDSGAGTQTAALLIAGSVPPSLNAVEEYNGSSWTAVASINTGRMYGASGGTVLAAITATGYGPGPVRYANTETYNGTSWTEVNDINTTRSEGAGSGNTTNALIYGGNTGSASSASESWNGTSWTNTPSINTARYGNGGSGTGSTSALTFGGNTPASTANTESYDGTSWTEVNNLNSARAEGNRGGGTQTSTIYAGGASTTNETWNGTSWSSAASMSVAKSNNGGAGSGAQAYLVASAGPVGTETEEFTAATVNSTITVS